MTDQKDVWSTTDFSIAAYLHSLGIRLINATLKPGSRQDYEFHFDDRSGKCSVLAIKFLNTEEYRFDQSQRALKKLAFGWNSNSGGEKGTWDTTDFSLAAFIMSRGCKLVGFRRTHQTRREYQFNFIDDGRCDSLSLSFVNSDPHKFDQSQRALKKLIFSR